MSPKRLFDQASGPSPGLRLDAGDLILPRRSTGLCGLAVCLQSALDTASLQVPYSGLMGLLNAAFMLRVDADLSLAATVESRWTRLVETLDDLGFDDARLLEASLPDDLVRGELTAGRAMCALGWGDGAADWSLICGLSEDELAWWGYEFCAAPVLVSGDSDCRMLLAIGERSGQPDFAQAEDAAIVAAAQLSDSPTGPVAAYSQWAELMRRKEPFPEGPAGDEMVGRHEWLTHVLLDARTAAVAFLQNIADRTEAATADDLLRAADLYEMTVETLEARHPALYAPMIAGAMRDAHVRADWADLLETAAGFEAEALQALGRVARGATPGEWQEEG